MYAAVPTRITSIDALRGLTVAFMILVNDPGDWAHTYPPLDHAPWNGFTPTDLVFPMFLFLVGCSIVFSVESRLARGVPRPRIALGMLRRAVVIFGVKMFLTAYPHFHLTHLRLFGVLTRIALCYLIAGLIFLLTARPRVLLAVVALILVGYWVLLRFVPVPGLGHPVVNFPLLDPDRNLAAWLDRGFNAWCLRLLHTGRLYERTRDPEGLLSTLPAVATTLLGTVAALWLRRPIPHLHQLRGKYDPPSYLHRQGASTTAVMLAAAGVVCLGLGWLWNSTFPVNKNLWTSSYALVAAGWSMLLLAGFFWLFDGLEVQRRFRIARAVVWPLLVFGSNAITAFALSNLLVLTLLWIKLPGQKAGSITAWNWLYLHLFALRGSTNNTSLAFALAFVVVCFAPNWLLWRRKLFLRV